MRSPTDLLRHAASIYPRTMRYQHSNIFQSPPYRSENIKAGNKNPFETAHWQPHQQGPDLLPPQRKVSTREYRCCPTSSCCSCKTLRKPLRKPRLQMEREVANFIHEEVLPSATSKRCSFHITGL